MLIAFHHHESTVWGWDAVALQRMCARLMIASVIRAMPDVEFLQMTNMTTPALVGRVMRRAAHPDGWAITVCEQHAALPPDTVILDTDVIVLADLAELIISGADLVVTRRRDPERRIAGRYMPYLFGVCASRTPAIWLDMRERVSKMTGDDAAKWGMQMALPGMIAEGRWNIQSVPCEEWNYTPKAGESTEGRKVLHYKGKRKELMVQEWGIHV